MYTKIVLTLVSLLFAAFAAITFLDPIGMASSLGVDVSGPNGAYELRGIYGGVSLGAALLCAAGAVRPAYSRPALWFLVTYMGGYVFARGAALLMGPAPEPAFFVFVAFEVIVLAAALGALHFDPQGES